MKLINSIFSVSDIPLHCLADQRNRMEANDKYEKQYLFSKIVVKSPLYYDIIEFELEEVQ